MTSPKFRARSTGLPGKKSKFSKIEISLKSLYNSNVNKKLKKEFHNV